jgi:hypothetical protein
MNILSGSPCRRQDFDISKENIYWINLFAVRKAKERI